MSHRWLAMRVYLHELNGAPPAAAACYAEAARRATDVAERDHLIRHARSRAATSGPVKEAARDRDAG